MRKTSLRLYLQVKNAGAQENPARAGGKRKMPNRFKVSRKRACTEKGFESIVRAFDRNWPEFLHKQCCRAIEEEISSSIVKTPLSEIDYAALRRPHIMPSPIEYYSLYGSYTSLQLFNFHTLPSLGSEHGTSSAQDVCTFYDSEENASPTMSINVSNWRVSVGPGEVLNSPGGYPYMCEESLLIERLLEEL
ncbi:uncharacterized protein NEMAJ01_1054 [Nematocida major]|uniref:uncharacterized protein n=1 Tax=Nematocida major TaxID=1912982 RepID=UPI0020074C22|nr:uncharacterized protein NEMAJ01_1054 [Nematocida major]KAH9386158.1 hypothetical protein NEMAJ01_1054 [Nematocida major]